jgi:molybdate transport system substrate-binding protein
LLRERIEGGAACSVFASANRQHPQALRQAGRAGNAIVCPQPADADRPSRRRDEADWLALLTNPQLRLATSTPGCDPSGDYTWQLFERIEARFLASAAR